MDDIIEARVSGILEQCMCGKEGAESFVYPRYAAASDQWQISNELCIVDENPECEQADILIEEKCHLDGSKNDEDVEEDLCIHHCKLERLVLVVKRQFDPGTRLLL